MTDNRLNLFCVVDGQSTSNAFPLTVSPVDTIGGLKELIKAKKANDFQDVDADKLTLWRVSIPITKDNKHKPINLNESDSPTELDPTDELSDVFEDKPPKKTIHVIVQRPSPLHSGNECTM